MLFILLLKHKAKVGLTIILQNTNKHGALWSKSKDWLVWNHYIVCQSGATCLPVDCFVSMHQHYNKISSLVCMLA